MEKDKTIKIRLIVSFGIFFLCFSLTFCKKSQSKTEVFELISVDNKSKLYIKRKVWGVTSDYQVTVISNSHSEIVELDSTVDYIYKGLEPFVYKMQSDTLIIYTMQPCSEPHHFNSSKMRVVQRRVSNPEYMDLMYQINSGATKELNKI